MGGLLLYLCLGKARWCRGWMGVVVVVGWVCPWWLRLLSLCVCVMVMLVGLLGMGSPCWCRVNYCIAFVGCGTRR